MWPGTLIRITKDDYIGIIHALKNALHTMARGSKQRKINVKGYNCTTEQRKIHEMTNEAHVATNESNKDDGIWRSRAR